MISSPFVTDFLLIVCVTLWSHYSSGLMPQAPVLDEALVRALYIPWSEWRLTNTETSSRAEAVGFLKSSKVVFTAVSREAWAKLRD